MNQPDCKACPEGKYCDPYELNNVTGVIMPVDCPPGYYCPLRTEYALQNPCEPGTFSNRTQLKAQCKKVTGNSHEVSFVLYLSKYICFAFQN